ncbi:PREDICTED: uncharacterized protein LOC104712482 isoform X2 [Camelina sativa]|uniref:Uncharacterized protein LOC104712482 isoform X2 n=1 Tax=Camelina sativa TaxID=90675 RepID=A0ABM0TKE2_CAMSA|nr:PREDICTED: uncharacterized protein LOC104712482 isoform X2 [Camelina sativa]
MAKPENDKKSPEKQTWSTMEELLLACAVHRHGTDSWDSVAAEIQKQNSTVRTLTAFDCRHKYCDLKRRFSRELVSPGSTEGEQTVAAEISSVPWLEELRKLRVDELRREVERYDLSISSLQLKVKRLEDEREESLKIEDSDLDKIAETKENHRDSGNTSGAVPVDEPVNSPDPKDNNTGTGSDNTNRDVKIAEPVDEEPNRIENDEKPVREDSGRGSCESAGNSGREDTVREGNNSPEFVESMDESKGEEETKETSDVQSSASLPRKETVEQDQPDNEDQSLTVNMNPVESQPLIDFIEILKSHPIGSHFSRRLESQETPEYDRIIRQHIDFEMIRSRVEEGYYKNSRSKFFRDLLLLINNGRVFYGESSSEFNAAKQLYQLIKKQMTLKIPKQTLPPPKEESLVTSKEEVTVPSLKPTTLSVPMIACRKRSSLAVRTSASVTEPSKKKTKVVSTVDEKPVSEEEKDETSDKDEEPIVSKKMTRARAPSTAKKVGSRNVKTSLNAGLPSKGRSSNDSSEPKKIVQDKKGKHTSGGSKKQSAASFLKRMKGVSSSETVAETVKADSANGKRGAEQRKTIIKNEKVGAAKLSAGQKRSTGKKPTIEKGSPAKKTTGVASKRSSPLIAKRDSETIEKEAGSSTRPKKRSRR